MAASDKDNRRKRNDGKKAKPGRRSIPSCNIGNIASEKRNRFFMREYRKLLKREKDSEKRSSTVSEFPANKKENDTENTRNENRHVFGSSSKGKLVKTALDKAQNEYKVKCQQKKQECEKRQRQIEETESALKRYNETKSRKMKKLGKKTKYGQPVMNNRIELLLEKIKTMK
ncbi:Uncharacterised protein g10678 [Pycnogonum litorale]